LLRSQVGITPSVRPLCGSVSISGIGMNGAVAGLSQRATPEGGGAIGAAGGAAGTGADSSARAPYPPASSASAQAAAHLLGV
jgi:hypothetical protein